MRVSIQSNVGASYRGYLAGTDDLRASLLNEAFASDEFDAFFFARGGYGIMRILDRIDYGALRDYPRPIVGFSDVTALLHAVASQAGVATFHGPMLNLDFHDGLAPDIEQWLWSMLAGDAGLERTFDRSMVLRGGSAEGVFFGGCLSLQVALIDTPYEFWVDDGIWFWEDVDEPLYRIDRMLTHLRLSGRLNSLRAVMIGKLKSCDNPARGDFEKLLLETFDDSAIPILYNLPFGHHGNNLALPVGLVGQVDADSCQIRFSDPAVELIRGT